MVSVIIFVLLFNLTYILAQGIPIEHIFNDNSPYYQENNSKLKNINSNSTQLSAKKITDDQEAVPQIPYDVKIANDPFSGKDVHNLTHRQVEKSNEGINQSPIKLNKETESQNVSPKAKQVIDPSNNTQVKIASSTNNSSKEIKNNNTTSENKNLEKNTTLIPTRSKHDIMQSGPLLRGFYVFLGLSAMIMMYFIFRSYRLRHGTQPSITVRKYGVTARRSDMEMRPLELDDDDDDTLFEIGNQNANR